jgi:hypothetical protein
MIPTAAPQAPPAVRVSWSGLVAGGLVALVGFDHHVYRTLSLATVAGIALVPVWWPAVSRYRGAWPLLSVGALAGIAGVWLTESAGVDHHTSTAATLTVSFVLLNILVGIALLLWARTLMRTSLVALLFGIGMVAAVPLGGLGFDEHAWRFQYSVPVSVLLLAGAWYLNKRWLEVLLALTLAAASAAAGGRSTFAMLLVAAIVTAWQGSRKAKTKTGSRLRIVLFGGALVFAIYQVGQGLILDGYLGESAQERTQVQIETTGNILLGARPELGATIALMAEQPTGFGSGTLSSLSDVRTAKAGMAELGYDPDNGYVDRYMFGAGFELHSLVGDFWAAFGLAGLAFILLAAWFACRGCVGLIARRAGPALLVYLTVRLLWNTFFGPIIASSTLVIAALGLILALKLTDVRGGSDLDEPQAADRSELRSPEASATAA